VDDWLGWRAPFATSVVVALAALALLGAARPDEARPRPTREVGLKAGVLRDRGLYRLAALYGACLGAGIPFAPAFTGAAALRPDAPAAAVGLVNGAASAVALVGTPLLGVSFALPGDGRLGFVLVAVLWAASLLVLPTERKLGVTRAPGSRSG
jgi:predicted MFS family arabinose efflux permease